MRLKIFVLLSIFFSSLCFATEIPQTPPLGVYSAFTEADWTVAFELKKGGKAVITTKYEKTWDEKNQGQSKKETIPGIWEYRHPNLIISWNGFKDQFVRASDCQENRPCFKYEKFLQPKSTTSPLNVKFEFIQWK